MNLPNFACEICNFRAKNKYRFEYHMKSKRHQKIVEKIKQIQPISNTPPTSPPQQNIRIETIYDSIQTTESSPTQTIALPKYVNLTTPLNIECNNPGFLDDSDAFYKLVKNKTDISEYLNIIYNKSINLSEFFRNLYISYYDIIELKDIVPYPVINHKFVVFVYKLLFKYINQLPIDERPIHFHRSLIDDIKPFDFFIRHSCDINWYIREDNKWHKLDSYNCISMIDLFYKDSTKLTIEFYDKIMRPLLIQCVFSWTRNYIENCSETEKQEHYKLGIILNKCLVYCEKDYLFSINPPSEDIDL